MDARTPDHRHLVGDRPYDGRNARRPGASRWLPLLQRLEIDADRSGIAANTGVGLEYFVADNIALGAEAKYFWLDPVEVRVAGESFEYDASNWAVTVGLRLYLAENHPKPLVTAIPQVRYSWPLRGGRWVPYAAAGVGVAFGELNDLKPASDGRRLDAGGLSPAASAGVGLEWFIARNLSFHLEIQWKQVWGQSAELDGLEQSGGFSQVQLLIALLTAWTRLRSRADRTRPVLVTGP